MNVIQIPKTIRNPAVATLSALASIALAPAANAQWTVTNLHPAGATFSYAYAASGGQQGGQAFVNAVTHASRWRGTAASWVDLHPAGTWSSVVIAASGGQQAGYAVVGGVFRASLWSGTAASWVDLHPAGSTYSDASAASSGQQAGWAIVGGVTRASLWSGTAASWVDLHPAGSTQSYVLAASGGQQVGWAVVGGVNNASLWSATAASWVDLHSFLPAGFSESIARGISSDGVNMYVVGNGYNTLTGRNEALLWTRPLPSPPCPADFNGDGVLDFFDYSAFVECFETGVCGENTADFNNDGFVDFFDYDAFVEAFEAGC
jgi:hypothetical protein